MGLWKSLKARKAARNRNDQEKILRAMGTHDVIFCPHFNKKTQMCDVYDDAYKGYIYDDNDPFMVIPPLPCSKDTKVDLLTYNNEHVCFILKERYKL